MVKWCKERGIKILTFYTFSTENWRRSKIEVNYLMKLLGRALSKKSVEKYHRQGGRLRFIGQRWRLSPRLQKAMEEAERLTGNNRDIIINIAISYGGRAEIVETVKKIIKKKISPENITEELISQNLWTGGMPDPDLIIRTGGEKRISNFLIWQSSYAELYFSPKYWPDFTEKDLDQALQDYDRRQRRFGK